MYSPNRLVTAKRKTEKTAGPKGQAQKRQADGLAFVTGEQIPFLGGSLPFVIHHADSRLVPDWIAQLQDGIITYLSRNNKGEAVFCADGHICMYTLEIGSVSYKQQLYDSWQSIQAGILCRRISRQYYPCFEQLGVGFPEIKIRKMRSRWGSCMPGKQKITYNSLLLAQPLECIEYVVVHEFAHFIHPDHSKDFYHFVEQVMPDWKKRRDRLGRQSS